MRVGINGFGRMGRLSLRAAWELDNSARALLQPYFRAGVRKVVVSAPVAEGALNLVMGC